jgi:hypothetical protein
MDSKICHCERSAAIANFARPLAGRTFGSLTCIVRDCHVVPPAMTNSKMPTVTALSTRSTVHATGTLTFAFAQTKNTYLHIIPMILNYAKTPFRKTFRNYYRCLTV